MMPGHLGRILLATYEQYSTKVTIDGLGSFLLVIKPYQASAVLRSISQAWQLTQLKRTSNTHAKEAG